MTIDKIFEKIKDCYSKSEIPEKLDLEILNWIDEGWESTHYCEYDWYKDFCNGEAEDVIIQEMIEYGVGKLKDNKKLSIDEHCELDRKLREYYELEF